MSENGRVINFNSIPEQFAAGIQQNRVIDKIRRGMPLTSAELSIELQRMTNKKAEIIENNYMLDEDKKSKLIKIEDKRQKLIHAMNQNAVIDDELLYSHRRPSWQYHTGGRRRTRRTR